MPNINTNIDQALHVYRGALADAGRSARVLEEYPRTIMRFHRKFGGILQPPEVMRGLLEGWREDMRTAVREKVVHPGTVRNDVATLRNFFEVLHKRRLYPANPASELPSQSVPKWEPKPLPLAHVHQIIRSVKPFTSTRERTNESDAEWADIVAGKLRGNLLTVGIDREKLRNRTMLELYYYGTRNTEVCTLTTDRVSYDPERATFNITVIGKRRKTRVVPLQQTASYWLALHLLDVFAQDEWRTWALDIATARQSGVSKSVIIEAALRLWDGELRTQPDLVFRTGMGRPMTRREVDRWFAEVRESLGFPADYTPHRFRHTCATQLLNKGKDIRVIQEYMGHDDIGTTQQYTAVADALKAVASDALADTDDELAEVA